MFFKDRDENDDDEEDGGGMDADIDCSLESSYATREIPEHRRQQEQQQQQQQQQQLPRRQFHGRNRGAQNSNKYFIESVFLIIL